MTPPRKKGGKNLLRKAPFSPEEQLVKRVFSQGPNFRDCSTRKENPPKRVTLLLKTEKRRKPEKGGVLLLELSRNTCFPEGKRVKPGLRTTLFLGKEGKGVAGGNTNLLRSADADLTSDPRKEKPRWKSLPTPVHKKKGTF